MSQAIATIICAVIAAASAIAVAVIEHRAASERERTENRAERRAKESRLSMELMYATCGLAMDTALAMRDGHTNGTLESDYENAKTARQAYKNFLMDEAAHNVAKV